MRAVRFEGTPEEFARVEAMFREGADPALQRRSVELPLGRPKAWPELGEEHCYQLAKRVLERAPARLVQALGILADAQNLHGEQTIEAWASDANQLPDELCGVLAELGRCASRAFIELFGCASAPERVRGAAYMLVEKIPSDDGTYFAVRPGLLRAMAELGLLDPLALELEEHGEAALPEDREATRRPTCSRAPSSLAPTPDVAHRWHPSVPWPGGRSATAAWAIRSKRLVMECRTSLDARNRARSRPHAPAHRGCTTFRAIP